jgi:predicted permease
MMWMMGRLKPGLTMPTAAADITVVAKQLAKVYDKFYPPEFEVHTRVLNDLVLGDFKGMIYALMAAVMMLLLIACSNVANLLLARATTRDRELAIRSSIGARPGRLVRQLLAESFVLAAAGLAAGCFLAYLGLRAVVANIPQGPLPDEAVIGLNPVVLFLAIAITVLTTFLCGLAPARHAMRGDLPSRLASGGPNLGAAFRNGKLRAGLVVTEVALSLVLLTGAGLMVRSFLAVVRVNPGFDPAAILFTGVNFAKNSHDTVDRQKVFFQQALERVRTLPGVTAAAAGSSVPSLEGGPGGEVDIPGKTHSEKWFAMVEFSSEDYFRTLQVPLVRGRALTPADIESRQQVVVINQALATTYFGKDDPVGQKMQLKLLDDVPDAPHHADFTIVGVVADFKNVNVLGPTMPEAFIPITISTVGYRRILMRTTLDPESLMPEVRRAIWTADPNVATGSNGTIEHWLKETDYKSPRFNLGVLGIFAGIGLALAIVGIFSVMAYTVSLQTHELGIRMALGAQRGDVLRLVLLKGLRLIVAGVVAGLLASFGLTRFLASQLWGVSANDSWTYAVVVALIAAAGVTACFLPARKATQVDPIIAIRCE